MAVDEPVWSAGFLSALVHELRTPVASLLLSADLLAGSQGLEPRQARYVRTLEDAAADLQALLDEAGELNRVRGGRLAPSRHEVSTEEVLQRACAPLCEQAAAAGVELDLGDAASSVPRLASDGALLARSLGALVRSAMAAGARRVALRVALEEGQPGRVAFEVIDDGEAVAGDELPRLFVPFAVSCARTRRPHGGTGLDLPLAAALAELLDGRLEARMRADGAGMILRLALPSG